MHILLILVIFLFVSAKFGHFARVDLKFSFLETWELYISILCIYCEKKVGDIQQNCTEIKNLYVIYLPRNRIYNKRSEREKSGIERIVRALWIIESNYKFLMIVEILRLQPNLV